MARCEVAKGEHTCPRSHDLKPDTEPRTATHTIRAFNLEAKKNADKIDRRGLSRTLGQRADLEKFIFDLLARSATQMLKDLPTFVDAAGRDKVARTVGQCLDSGKQEERRKALEGKEESPAHGRVALLDKGEAKVEPVRNRDTEIVGDEDVSEEATTVTSTGDLADKDWSNARQCAGADSGEDARADDEVEILSGRLESTSYEAEEGGVEESIHSANSVGDPPTDETSKDGSQIIA